MSLITQKPDGLPPEENALRNIPDDLLGPHPAVVQAFGKDLLKMDKPPEPGELLKIEITLRCKDEGRELLDSGDFKYYRKCKSLGANVTVEPYKPEAEPTPPPPPDDDPAMFGRDCNIPDDEPEDDGGHNDHVHVETEPDDGGLNEFDPAFSHNGVAD